MTPPLRLPVFRAILLACLAATPGGAQTQPPPTQPPTTATPATAPATTPPLANPNAKEIDTKEAPAIFKTRVNLVMVPVVVRDSKGKAVGTFTKDNFQLFDKGKPQEITRFTVEKSGDQAAKAAKTADVIPVEGEPPAPPDIPERFIAYLFDDLHLESGDLMRSRDAAGRQLAKLAKTDRAAIYTTSGQNQIDFTDDQDKLQSGLLLLRTRAISGGGIAQCPDISYYMADKIINLNDSQALSAAVQETQACSPNLPPNVAASLAQAAAQQVLGPGHQESQIALAVLKDVVRRMGGMPGQRLVVLISPGFISPNDLLQEHTDILDRAIKANVVISGLDARGLWVDPMVDVSRSGRTATSSFLMLKQQYDREAALAQEDILAELAYGTGGSFFHNNNDLEAGLGQLTVAPDYYYILGFSPQNLKLDGTFHSLKVVLKTIPPPSGMNLQARKGYYAPKKLSTAEETAKQEIEEALFSREEMSELPVELHTQFFKGDKDATVSVLCRLDPKRIQFRKSDGRNFNIVTIVSGLFDRNGNFVSGVQKTVDLRLKDDTLAKLIVSGMAIKTTFSVQPGTYMVRLVVRDTEGQMMSALNGAVAIQ